MKILLSELEDRVKFAEGQVPDIILMLDSTKPIQEFVENKKDRNTNFKLLTGKLLISAWQDLLKKAKHDVLRVWSSDGIRSNYTQGLVEDFRECVAGGFRVRGIAEINKYNILESEEFASVLELRHLEPISDAIRYQIIDRSDIIISTMNVKEAERRLQGLQTNNKVLVTGFVREFEKEWEKAIPAKNRIEEIRNHKK